ncbi:MAG: cytochrome ubiquinol oxidase subunit I [Phenylobacterium sp.]|jgi:cytochrome d ubiquinol oxidase subunit I|uniref:cytochrome ubiquinol oxidase subunit I n=1 Tax=Phenylobacterium sp. TaxID=1871053 RepID=UPI002A33134A|nr:cytochrome ubiquinol oxidase subunit I [Phenylobacterium sp.]MDD3837569.1 cytochrome ubiquinol oxidase subunit I [Phenylobacterium sp.]MDX9998679.1 cytochrome ubiquinol oxidase subunit I [Phenylobacterium sp.]
MDAEALLLARLQFAFTIAFHIIFPSFTIGLASYLAVLEGLWLTTKAEAFKTLYLFWVKIFALSFGMGVVSGVVMSYQLGTNWSVFSAVVSPVIGPLLAFEVLTAFFLEASFLGVMLFGWRKVGPKLHFASTVLVAFGTVLSAFWIISANSWMQDPSGFTRLQDGSLRATSWMEVIFSPSFPERFAHMVLAAYLTTALVVAAAAAWRLLKSPGEKESAIALRMAIGMFAMVAPLQLVVGDISGKQMLESQPSKMAAIEAFWETRAEQPFHVIAWPDRETESNRFELSIPKIGSWIVAGETTAEVPGLTSFAPEDRPPVAIVFWSFRVMVGLGLLMIALGAWGAWLYWRRGGPEANRSFLRACVAMGPTGFIAVIAGWIVAEVGRQPWVVYGVLRTADAVSPVGAGEVSASLLGFLVVYAIVFSVGALYILRLIAEGPVQGAAEPPPDRPGPRQPSQPLAAAPVDPKPEAGE